MDLTDFTKAASPASGAASTSSAALKEDMRRRAFKATIDAEDSRRKREEVQIKIRKQKKMTRLNKRRMAARGVTAAAAPAGATGANAAAHHPELVAQIPAYVAGVNSADVQQQLSCTAAFRKMLSIETYPPIQQVRESGVVPRLVTFLRHDDNPRLQFEAAWALTNIASGTSADTHFVVDNGAVPFFVYLLNSPSDDVREQAVWALGNIAGDSPALRDMVVAANALPPLVNQLKLECKLGMVRNATWALSNLCRGKPPPKFELVAPALETLSALIFSGDEEVLTDACWALSYLSDGPNDHIQAVIQSGVCHRLIELLGHPAPAVQTPALRTVGNMVTGDDLQTQVVINCGALHALANLLDSRRKGIRKEACWTISNITAGSLHQIDAVLKANVVPRLVRLLRVDQWDIQKEAAWAISNATSGGTKEQVCRLVELGCIPPLCKLLESTDPKVVTVALEGLDNILKIGALDARDKNLTYNKHARSIEEAGGVRSLEALWTHDDHEIYYKAVRILRKFWDAIEDPDPTLATETGENGNAATFGIGDDMVVGDDFGGVDDD